MPDLQDITAEVKSLVAAAGFAQAAVTTADPLCAEDFAAWINDGCHGPMDYLARQGKARYHPADFLPDARSVICLAVSYRPAVGESINPLLPLYVRGRDYHRVLKNRAQKLCAVMADRFEGFQSRISVDAGALAERSLALRAGLGFRGGQGLLISPELGACVFLAIIVCNLELQPDTPLRQTCGDCDACRNACPTGAIHPDGTLDARKCLAGLMTESDQPFPEKYFSKVRSLFSCDLCLRACPHARPGKGGDPEFSSAKRPDLLSLTPEDILAWTQADWDAATTGSAMRRTRLPRFLLAAILTAVNTNQPIESSQLNHLCTAWPELRSVIDYAASITND